MNAKDIKLELLNKFPKGTEFDGDKIARNIFDFIVGETHQHVSTSRSNHIITIMFWERCVACVKVRRNRIKIETSNAHKPIYKWFVKGFDVMVVNKNETIEDRIKEIKNTRDLSGRKEGVKICKYARITRTIMEKHNMDIKDFRDYISYMNNWANEHRIMEEIKGDKKDEKVSK